MLRIKSVFYVLLVKNQNNFGRQVLKILACIKDFEYISHKFLPCIRQEM